MNIKLRWKNPWTYIFIISTVLTAIGVDPTTFTSWEAVKVSFMGLINNPFLLGTAFITVIGIFYDPTTAGFGDSKQALTYTSPKKD